MPKRKLYGAALAAYNKKRGRGTTAIARRGPSSVVTKTRTKYVKVRGRRRRGGGAVSGVRPLRSQMWDLGGAAGYGFLTGDHGKAPVVRAYVQKVPILDAIGAPASHGLLLHFIAQRTGGQLRRALGHLSHAALMQAFHNLGTTGFEFDAAVKLSGDDYNGGDELAGEVDMGEVDEADVQDE
jgi:hypothetical protein